MKLVTLGRQHITDNSLVCSLTVAVLLQGTYNGEGVVVVDGHGRGYTDVLMSKT